MLESVLRYMVTWDCRIPTLTNLKRKKSDAKCTDYNYITKSRQYLNSPLIPYNKYKQFNAVLLNTVSQTLSPAVLNSKQEVKFIRFKASYKHYSNILNIILK